MTEKLSLQRQHAPIYAEELYMACALRRAIQMFCDAYNYYT